MNEQQLTNHLSGLTLGGWFRDGKIWPNGGTPGTPGTPLDEWPREIGFCGLVFTLEGVDTGKNIRGLGTWQSAEYA